MFIFIVDFQSTIKFLKLLVQLQTSTELYFQFTKFVGKAK